MTIIRQPSLFSIQELYDMEPTQKYDTIISAINMDAIYNEVNKKSLLAAPTELNYAPMAISVVVRYIERIPTIKDLVKRVHHDVAFTRKCCFLVSDEVPSEASSSRLFAKSRQSNV